MHIHISPYSFLIGTKLATQVVCQTRKIILATSNFFKPFLTNISNEGFIFSDILLKWLGIFFQWNYVLNDLRVIIIEILLSPRGTSLYCLNNFMKVGLSAWVQFVPRFIVCGFCLVPRLTASYLSDELLVFVLVDLLNLSWRSKSFSSLTMFLGMVLLCSSLSFEVEA